jgi:hypothetical protein
MYTRLVPQVAVSRFEAAGDFVGQCLSLLKKTPSGLWSVPTRIEPDKCDLSIRVSAAKLWPLVIVSLSTGIVVSEQIALHFMDNAGQDVQILPVMILPPKDANPPPKYFFVNCLRCEDVLNLTLSRALNTERDTKEFERLTIDGNLVIDAQRAPRSRELFSVKYVGYLILGEKLTRALGAIATTDFKLEPVRNVPEPQAERAAILRRLKAELKARSVASGKVTVVKTVSALEKLLEVKLPAAASKYFAAPPEIVDCATELFDVGRAAEETQRLRQWNDLQWPAELVCISDDGRGGYWALDTGKAKAGDCPVLYFDHELADVDRKSGRITPNFELAAPTLRDWLSGLEAEGTGLPPMGGKAKSGPSKKVRKKAKKK